MKRRRKIIIGLVIAVILLFAGAWALGLFKKDKQEQSQPPKLSYSQLTGVEVDADTARRPVLGIMLENSEEARPQTGLGSAGIVFEAVTEGGITRYLALFQENMPEIVGPVRSLRTHFLDWGMGFEASIAHVGGSAQALELAEQRDARTLNEFKYSEPYYRDNKRAAPHNMYTRTKDLRELQAKLGYNKSSFAAIPRTNDSPSETPPAAKVAIDFSSPEFSVEFRYDKTSNSYNRYLAGTPDVDAASSQLISVKNLVVLKSVAQDGVGGGEALVFKDGNVVKGRWEQRSYKERIKIYGSDNSEIPLNRGRTWIAGVAAGRPVAY